METDDVVGWYRTFEAMSHSGVRFRAPSGESDWRAADAISAGADAARLYHAAPETLGHTGIAMLPTLPFWDDRRRRLLVRAPRAGGNGRAAVDAAFWRGVRSALTGAEWRALRSATPILMYHAFDVAGGGSKYVVTRRRLRRQLRLLRLVRSRSRSTTAMSTLTRSPSPSSAPTARTRPCSSRATASASTPIGQSIRGWRAARSPAPRNCAATGTCSTSARTPPTTWHSPRSTTSLCPTA